MAGEIQLNSTTLATESSGSITAQLDTVRPNTTNGSLTLQGDSSDAGVTGLTIDSSGNATFAQTISGGTIGSSVVFPSGHIIKTYSVTFQGADSNGTNTYVVVGDGDTDELEITTDTPKSTSSKFLLTCSIGAVSDNSAATTSFRFNRNGTFISESGNNGMGGVKTAASFRSMGGGSSNHPVSTSFTFLDSPASSTALTYSITFRNQSGITSYINRSQANADTSDTYGTHVASTLTIFEIA